jgi:hypothetical protein
VLQHPVTDRHLRQIGDITVSFALVENVMQGLAWSLIGRDQQVGQIVTAELSFQRLRALTLSLYRVKRGDDPGFDTLKELMGRAATVEQDRNRIVHSVWGAGKGETITRIKATAKEKQGLRFGFEEVTEDDLRQLGDALKELAHDIQRFWISLYPNAESQP